MHPKEITARKQLDKSRETNGTVKKGSKSENTIPPDSTGNHSYPVVKLSYENVKKHVITLFNEIHRIRLIDLLARFDDNGVSVLDLHRCITELLEDGDIYNDGEALVKIP